MRDVPRRAAALLVVALAASACRGFTKQAADREVYGILAEKRRCVPELVGSLHVEAEDRLAEALRARRAFLLRTDDAVALAMVASRDYRRQRENVYLAALDLTLEQQQFRPLFAGGGSAGLDTDASGTRLDAGADWRVTRALATGGSLVLSIATDFLANLTGSPARTAQTLIDSEITLPLWRSSGRLVALEPLRQAQRDTLYALRDFARTQQELRVQIATRIYNALAQRDTVQNEERAYQSLQDLVDEQTLKAQAGKIPEYELDQARQDLLRADDRRQRARRRYEDALDQLKLDLGVPMAVEVRLDPEELEALRAEALPEAPYDLPHAMRTARRRRLDLANERGREEDALRQVRIALDDLKTTVDLTVGGSLDTPAERPFAIDEADPSGSVGLDIDLPLERTAERNAYVRARISAMRARRDRQALEDRVDLEVRAAWRALVEARRSYEIQRQGVRLAERRVESTGLLLQQGTADIRDRLEAEDARVEAQNALTAALVDHVLALLAFERDVGTLAVAAPDLDAHNGFPPADASVAPAGAPAAPAGPPAAPSVASGARHAQASGPDRGAGHRNP